MPQPAAFFRYAFPYRLEPDDAGGILLELIDVRETHTFAPTATDAGDGLALDGLIAALGSIELGRAIPRPSPAEGRPVAILPRRRRQVRALRCRRTPSAASSISTTAAERLNARPTPPRAEMILVSVNLGVQSQHRNAVRCVVRYHSRETEFSDRERSEHAAGSGMRTLFCSRLARSLVCAEENLILSQNSATPRGVAATNPSSFFHFYLS